MRRMLINAVHPEECRVAICEDDQLLELEIERADQVQLKGNIYKSAITRIEPSLQAAFLDIGSSRNGFLQINDIHSAYFRNWPPEGSNGHPHRPSIQDVLNAGQELVVQVVKDERDLKGATLTTNLSIPGRFLVLMIGNQRGGVSRKIVDEGQRHRLKQAVQKLVIPAGLGVIVRTAGINRSSVELQRDLDSLLDVWYKILVDSQQPGAPTLLYKESDLAIRMVRDYLTSDIDEILIDDSAVYQRVNEFVEKVLPSFASRVIFYDRTQPLFGAFDLDNQVDAVNQPEVTLPSGGSIVINMTEAIVAVDVNSGRSTRQSDVEETAFNTNREAAIEIARQLRLRDLGGLIVIDFIDMGDKRHKQIVERALREAVRFDKAKVEIGRISKFGLLEMSRQRIKASLVSQSHVVCPHCSGRGLVKTAETAALEVMRKIESTVFAGGVGEIRVRMAPAAALLLLNEKRRALSHLEGVGGVNIRIYADGRLKPEEYELSLDTGKRETNAASLTEAAASRENRRPQQRDRMRDNPRQGGRDREGPQRRSDDRRRDQRSGGDDRREGGRDGGRDRYEGQGRGNRSRRRGGRGRRGRGRGGQEGGSGFPQNDNRNTHPGEISAETQQREPQFPAERHDEGVPSGEGAPSFVPRSAPVVVESGD